MVIRNVYYYISRDVLVPHDVQKYISNEISKYVFIPQTKQELMDELKKLPKNVSTWKVHNITDMSGLFEYYPMWLHEIPNGLYTWDVSNVTNMSRMFHGREMSFSDIYLWNVNCVTDMSSMFENAIIWTVDKLRQSRWNVSNVKSMKRMFYSTANVEKENISWNIPKNTDTTDMFTYLCIAIGVRAGNTTQGPASVAIGTFAR